MTMSFRLLLVMLMIQMWLWSTTAEGQNESQMEKVCIHENNKIDVTLEDCVSKDGNEWKFEVVGRVTNLTDCRAMIKIESAHDDVNPGNVKVSSISCLSTLTTTCATTSPIQSSIIAGSLGVIVGLLVILVALLMVALVWTSCIMNKRGKIIEQLNTRLSNIDKISSSQNCGDDSTSRHLGPSPIPTYKTIPDHQTAELKEHSYDILDEALSKRIYKDTKEQRRSEKVSSSESSRYTLKLTQMEESDQAHIEMGKLASDVRYNRDQTETEKDIKQDHTNTDQEKIEAKRSKEGGPASHSEDKCITQGPRKGERESATSEHKYFVLEENVKDSDNHQLENCDMEHDNHRGNSTTPKGATDRDYEDFVQSK